MTDEQNPEIVEEPEQIPVAPVSEPIQAPQQAPYVPNTGMTPDWVKARNAPCGYNHDGETCPSKMDPAVAFTDPETGTQVCSAHVAECEDCYTKHMKYSMHEYKEDRWSQREWFCDECYSNKFTECPNCNETIDVKELLPPTRRNTWSMKQGGCKRCCEECSGCSKIVDKDNTYHEQDQDWCEDCHSENFRTCEECGETHDNDSVTYVDNVGEFCDYCYRKKFTKCEDCDKEIEKSDTEEVDGDYYCEECATKHGPAAYVKYTGNFSEFTYTKKDRFINPLYKLLPLTVKELKSKHPALANGLADLIAFSKGKPITVELVKAYRESLSPEEFPVDYTAWDGVQRSIDSLTRGNRPNNNAQLVINVVASPEMLSKMNANPALYDLFDKVNTVSDKSTHPYVKDQIGWIRVELDPEGEYLLVDEIQSDHSNAAFQLKGAQEYSKVTTIKNSLIEKYHTNDLGVNQLLINKDLQQDEDIQTLRAIYKRKYQRTDEELDLILADKMVKKQLEDKLDEKYPDIDDPIAVMKNPQYHNDEDVMRLREIYMRLGKMKTGEELTQALEKGQIPPDLELQSSGEEIDQIRTGLKNQYGLDDAGLNNLLTVYSGILNDFPNIASQAVSRFAKRNNFKKIFWHTYESGMALKQNEPPKSLYDKTPKENFFTPSENKPFGLEGQFFEKEAKKATELYKTARKLYLKYLSVIS